MTSSLELKLRLYLVFGQAAPAAASPQWALSSPRVGCPALLGAEGLELPRSWGGGGVGREEEEAGLPQLGRSRLSDRC